MKAQRMKFYKDLLYRIQKANPDADVDGLSLKGGDYMLRVDGKYITKLSQSRKKSTPRGFFRVFERNVGEALIRLGYKPPIPSKKPWFSILVGLGGASLLIALLSGKKTVAKEENGEDGE